MSRPLRLQYPGAVYHVTSRGNARQRIFLGNPDRDLFLKTLSHVVSRYQWLCHAYSLKEVPRLQWAVVRPPLGQIFRIGGAHAVAIAYRQYGYRLKEIGDYLGVHHATVSRRLRRLEESSNRHV